MAHSATDNRPGKRDRLVASARELLHQRGVSGPTLAEIAEAADVPPGNVYYYFKTRDDLVLAVIEAQVREVDDLLARLDPALSAGTPACAAVVTATNTPPRPNARITSGGSRSGQYEPSAGIFDS